jgi:protein-S-isoprenylcysteine O-methyltransferase Ste14
VKLSPGEINQFAWVVWLASWAIAARWSSPTERRSNSPLEWAYRLLTACGAIFLFGRPRWLPRTALWHLGPAAEWALLATAVFGLLFTWWARIVLGRLWSSGVTRKTDHRIITAGPYRLVRHPIYSGIILAAVATAAMSGTADAQVGAALIALGLLVKARVEEGFLRQELGQQQYDAYARRVPMLIPHLRPSSPAGG